MTADEINGVDTIDDLAATDMERDQILDLLDDADHAFHREYRRHFPAGGDAGDHAEATRCGLEAVLLVAVRKSFNNDGPAAVNSRAA